MKKNKNLIISANTFTKLNFLSVEIQDKNILSLVTRDLTITQPFKEIYINANFINLFFRNEILWSLHISKSNENKLPTKCNEFAPYFDIYQLSMSINTFNAFVKFLKKSGIENTFKADAQTKDK